MSRSVLFSDNRKHDYFDFLFAGAITEPLHAVIFRDEKELKILGHVRLGFVDDKCSVLFRFFDDEGSALFGFLDDKCSVLFESLVIRVRLCSGSLMISVRFCSGSLMMRVRLCSGSCTFFITRVRFGSGQNLVCCSVRSC